VTGLSSVRDGTGQFCASSERVSRGRKSKFLSNNVIGAVSLVVLAHILNPV